METENKQLDTSDVLQAFYETAPVEIQKTVDNDDLFTELHSTSVKSNLDSNDEEILKQEILFVLLGMQSIDAFRSNLEKQLVMEKIPFENMARELFDLFFAKIEKTIRENYIKILREEENLNRNSSKQNPPPNLPVAKEGQKIPTFSSKEEKVMSNVKFPMSKENVMTNDPKKLSEEISRASKFPRPQSPTAQASGGQAMPKESGGLERNFEGQNFMSKPSYVPPDHVELVRSMSQDDIFAGRPQPKPYAPPTRDFKYRDEKIGGVNVSQDTNKEEIEENIDRNELLRDIENPVKSEATGGTPRGDLYKGGDPYREPFE